MGYDMFGPVPPLSCPRCRGNLSGWQGHDGPAELLISDQGRGEPVGEAAEDIRFSPEDLSRFRLPDRFRMKTVCSRMRLLGVRHGHLRTRLVWVASVHGTHVEGQPVKAHLIDKGWRQCSACGDAWQQPFETSYAKCPSCRALTHLEEA